MFSLLSVILSTALVASASSLQASCEMRLHNNGTKIGKVTFTSRGNNQRITVILKGDPEEITQGYHTLTVRTRAVQGKPANCDNTGDIFKKGGNVLYLRVQSQSTSILLTRVFEFSQDFLLTVVVLPSF